MTTGGDEPHPVDIHGHAFPDAALADALQDAELRSAEGRLSSIRKSDAVRVRTVGRGADDHTNHASRKHGARLTDDDFAFRDDPGSGWNDELHVGIVATVGRPSQGWRPANSAVRAVSKVIRPVLPRLVGRQ